MLVSDLDPATDRQPITTPEGPDLGPIPSEDQAWSAFQLLRQPAPPEVELPELQPRAAQLGQAREEARRTLDVYRRNVDKPFPTYTAAANAERERKLKGLFTGDLREILPPERYAELQARAAATPEPAKYIARQSLKTYLQAQTGKPIPGHLYPIARAQLAEALGVEDDDQAVATAIGDRYRAHDAATAQITTLADGIYEQVFADPTAEFAGVRPEALAEIPGEFQEAAREELMGVRRQALETRRAAIPHATRLTRILAATMGREDEAATATAGRPTAIGYQTAADAVEVLDTLPADVRAAAIAMAAQELEGLTSRQSTATTAKENVAGATASLGAQARDYLGGLWQWFQTKSLQGIPGESAGAARRLRREEFEEWDRRFQTRAALMQSAALVPSYKPTAAWTEKAALAGARQVPSFAAFFHPASLGALGMAMGGQSLQAQRIENPDGSFTGQFGAATMSGALQLGVEKAMTGAGLKFLRGKSPTVAGLLSKTGIRNKYLRGLAGGTANAAAAGATEYSEEIVQDGIDRLFSDVQRELDGVSTNLGTAPGAWLGEWLKPWAPGSGSRQAEETFYAILPFALIGSGLAGSYQHFKYGDWLQKSRPMLRAVGVPDAIITEIQAADPETAADLTRQAFETGLEEVSQSRREAALETFRESARLMGEAGMPVVYEDQADDGSPVWVFQPDPVAGAATRRLFDSEQEAFMAWEDAAARIETGALEAITLASREAALDLTFGEGAALEQTGEAVPIDQAAPSISRADKIRDAFGNFLATPAEIAARVQQFLLQGGNARDVDNLVVKARRHAVRLRDGTTRQILQYFTDTDPIAILEDAAEAFADQGIADGMLDPATLVRQIRATEAATGRRLLEEGYDPATYGANPAPLLEAFSALARDYAFANVRSEAMPDELRQWVGTTTMATGSAFGYAEELRRVPALRKALEEGRVDRAFERQLADAIGINQAERDARMRRAIEAQLAAEAMDGMPEIRDALAGRLPHPQTLRDQGHPLSGEVRRIYEGLKRPTRARTRNGRPVMRTNEANAYFLPYGQMADLDLVRRRLVEADGFLFDTPADMLAALDESINYGVPHHGTASLLDEREGTTYSMGINPQAPGGAGNTGDAALPSSVVTPADEAAFKQAVKEGNPDKAREITRRVAGERARPFADKLQRATAFFDSLARETLRKTGARIVTLNEPFRQSAKYESAVTSVSTTTRDGEPRTIEDYYTRKVSLELVSVMIRDNMLFLQLRENFWKVLRDYYRPINPDPVRSSLPFSPAIAALSKMTGNQAVAIRYSGDLETDVFNWVTNSVETVVEESLNPEAAGTAKGIQDLSKLAAQERDIQAEQKMLKPGWMLKATQTGWAVVNPAGGTFETWDPPSKKSESQAFAYFAKSPMSRDYAFFDPVENVEIRDAEGNVIPLSQRFDPSSPAPSGESPTLSIGRPTVTPEAIADALASGDLDTAATLAKQIEEPIADMRPQIGAASREIGMNGPGAGWDAGRNMSRNAAGALDEGKVMEPNLADEIADTLRLKSVPKAAVKSALMAAGYNFPEYHHVGKNRREVNFYDLDRIMESPLFWIGLAKEMTGKKRAAAVDLAQTALEKLIAVLPTNAPAERRTSDAARRLQGSPMKDFLARVLGKESAPAQSADAGRDMAEAREPSASGLESRQSLGPTESSFALSPSSLNRIESAIAAKMAAGPTERAEYYTRLRDRLAGVLIRYKEFALAPGATDAEVQLRAAREAIAEAQAIVQALPMDARGRVTVPVNEILDAKTQRGRVTSMLRLVDEADKALETVLQDNYREALGKLLDLAKPDLNPATRQARGRLTPDVQREVAKILDVMAMSPIQAGIAQHNADNEVQRTEAALAHATEGESLRVAQEAHIQARLDKFLLDTFGGVLEGSAADLAAAHDHLFVLYKQGRYQRGILDDGRRQRMQAIRQEVADSLPEVDQPKFSKKTGEAGVFAGLKNLAEAFQYSHYAFDQIMRALFPKSSSIPGLIDGADKADIAYRRGTIAAREHWEQWARTALNLPRRGWHMALKKILADLSTRQDVIVRDAQGRRVPLQIREGTSFVEESLDEQQAVAILEGRMNPGWHSDPMAMDSLRQALVNFRLLRDRDKKRVQKVRFQRLKSRGKPSGVHLAPLEIAYLLQLAGQKEYGPTLDAYGFTPAVLDALLHSVDERALRITDYLQDRYDRQWDRINPVFRELYGYDMPKIRNYAPGRFDHQFAQPEQKPDELGENTVSALGAGMTKNRINHLARPRQENALGLYWQHVAATEYFIAWALPLRDLRAVFLDPKIRRRIVGNYGETVAADFYQWLEVLAEDGRTRAREASVNAALVSNIKATQSAVGLAFNLSSFAIQAMNFFNGLLKRPFSMYVRGLAMVMRDPHYFTTVWKSETVQHRLTEGISPEDRMLVAQANQSPSRILEMFRVGRAPLGWHDTIWTSVYGSANYAVARREALDYGLSESAAHAHALDDTERLIRETAQPQATMRRSLAEVRASKAMFLLGYMFKSDVRQKFAGVIEGFQQFRRGTLTRREMARLVMFWMIYGAVAEGVRDLVMSGIRDDDDDERFSREDYLATAMAGPVGGAGIGGSMVESIIRAGVGTGFFRTQSVADRAGTLATNRGSRLVKQLSEDAGLTWDDAVRLALQDSRDYAMAAGMLEKRAAAPAVAMRIVSQGYQIVDRWTVTESERQDRILNEYKATQKTERETARAERAASSAPPPVLTPQEKALRSLKIEHRAEAIRRITATFTKQQREDYLARLEDLGILTAATKQALEKL